MHVPSRNIDNNISFSIIEYVCMYKIRALFTMRLYFIFTVWKISKENSCQTCASNKTMPKDIYIYTYIQIYIQFILFLTNVKHLFMINRLLNVN